MKTNHHTNLPDGIGMLMITSYPPRECGIATYSQDLLRALNNKFKHSLNIQVCALESGPMGYTYPSEVKYVLNTDQASEYGKLAAEINKDASVDLVVIQHEFGFYRAQEPSFIEFLKNLTKKKLIVFHTVLPKPRKSLLANVKLITSACQSIVVMTNTSASLLVDTYLVPQDKITVIPHGTHLVPHLGKRFLKNKYGFKGRKVLSTFGLLSSGKSLETTLDALPAIIKVSPDVLFLIIGKTHPEVVKSEGEKYRKSLAAKVIENNLSDHVRFINKYLDLNDLLEYLQLTDIYLFTSNDPNQAVSGTFVYAMSCGCPIISTPIPHAKEILTKDLGIIFEFGNSKQLANGVIRLLRNERLRRNIGINTLQKIVSTAWENSAVQHAMLFRKLVGDGTAVSYDLPPVFLGHVRRMTKRNGMIQFAKVNQPLKRTGYTLDDNARAMVACCMNYSVKPDEELLQLIRKYLRFIRFCHHNEGSFLNYVDKDLHFTTQNLNENLDDANGRAIWALGYLISLKGLLPEEIVSAAEKTIIRSLPHIGEIYSTRAMAFAIKGLFYYQKTNPEGDIPLLIKTLANRLVQMYRHESEKNWEWFEGYLTYANSILPEAILYAWLLTGDPEYKNIARKSMDFLLSQIFNQNGIEVISNKNWLLRGAPVAHFGEQPIDVAYTVMALSNFHQAFGDQEYLDKMVIAFSWFLGANRLHQIIYNPCTGGCYDGLEENNVNLNQGAESTVSYLMARLTIGQYDV